MLLLTKYGESSLLTTPRNTTTPSFQRISRCSPAYCSIDLHADRTSSCYPDHLAGLVKSSKGVNKPLLVFGIPGYLPRRYAHLFKLDPPSRIRFSCIMTIVNRAWLISCRAMLLLRLHAGPLVPCKLLVARVPSTGEIPSSRGRDRSLNSCR